MRHEASTEKKGYQVITNKVEWGPVTAVVFYYDYRAKDKDKYPLKIRVSYNRERVYFDTGYALTVDEWKRYHEGRGDIAKARIAIQSQMDTIKGHVEDMNAKNTFSLEGLNTRLGRGRRQDLIGAFEGKISDLRKSGNVGNAMIHECALNSIKEYLTQKSDKAGDSLQFSKIKKAWVEDYDKYMSGNGKNTTTRAIYMRCLRAVMNAAGVPTPFGNERHQFNILKGGGRKMALTKQQINNILMKYQVVPGSTADKMRDLFYFSFITNGINIKDLILLRWADIKNGTIEFTRAKTARMNSQERIIVAPIIPQMQKIIDKWGDRDSKYIFGYLGDKPSPANVRLLSQNLTRLMNKHLKKITDATGLPAISTYTARHSYATNLVRDKTPIAFISNMLGHADISTTQNYLDGFDYDDMKKYNTSLTED